MRVLAFAYLLLSVVCTSARIQSKLASVTRSDEKDVKEITDLVSIPSDLTVSAAAAMAVKKSSSSIGDWRGGAAAVAGGALVHLALGTLYCWGNFISYLPTNMKFYDGKDHSGSANTDAAIVIPLSLISQCLAMPFGPMLCAKFGASRTMLFGGLIAALGVFLSTFTTKLLPFAALYATLFGIGAGFAYTAPMTAGWKWLPNSKGLVTGIILCFYGTGGFVFNLLGTKLINPKALEMVNGVFPAEVYDNFMPALKKLALIYTGLAVTGYLLVTEPKVQSAASTDKSKTAAPVVVPGLGVKEALTTPQFWLLWCMVVSSATAGLNVASVYKQFAATSTALKGDGYQALVGGLGALFNGLGRLFWGTLSDKIGFKNSFSILTVTQAALHFVFTKSSSSKPMFAIALCSSYFLMAGNFALMPPAIARLYGTRSGTMIYGILFSAFGTASIGGMYLSKALRARYGWDGSFRILASMSIVACYLTTLVFPIKSFSQSTI